MDYKFSNRVLALKPSAIREILKSASDPSVISLSAGNPAPEAFPVTEIAEISARILRDRPIDALQYSVTEGYPALRTRLLSYLKERHKIGREYDDVLITSGAQQCADLLTKSLCNEGDVVLCEAPSFIGCLNTFRSFGAQLRGIPMDGDGMNLDALECALREESRAKFIYTIPNFQNPSGITMSLAKRRRLVALAKQYGVLILEDNPYGDLRFSGEPLPTIKSMDEDGLVVYCGSFSKVISPGFRVGYAVAPKVLLQKMVVCKQGEDVHTNIWSQMVCDEFLANCDFDAHLERLRGIYRAKSSLAVRMVEQHLVPHGITYNPIEGGLFLWCTLPEGADMPAFCKRAAQEYKVCVVPGNAFLTDEGEPCQSFRINFSTPTDEQLEKGIALLGKLAAELF